MSPDNSMASFPDDPVATNPDEVRERAWVDHRRPPVTDIDEAMWFAEDPVTDCAGVGRVEAEAVGNLVAVVTEFEAPGGPDNPTMKLPGRTVTRPSVQTDQSESVLDRVRSLF